MDWSELDGLEWTGVNWSGQDWFRFGMDWSGLV